MLLTIFTIISVLAWPLVAGVLMSAALNRRMSLTEMDWIDAPFLGGAALAIALQVASRLGLPVKYSAVLVIVLIVAAGFATVRGRWRHAVEAWRAFPALPFGAALAAYLLHGLGLLEVGARHYMGRAWFDQINYAALAEFLLRYPFAQPVSLDLAPHALTATTLREFRIGQSVLQAFLAVVTGADPKQLFEPLILWSAFLTALVAYAICRACGLPRIVSVVVEIVAACLPALAYVHLESFLSHALATPYFLFSGLLCWRAVRDGRPSDYIACALTLTATAAIYIELLPLLIALAVAVTIWQIVRWPISWPRVAWSAMLLVPVLALNHPTGIRHVLLNVGTKEVLAVLYPWAFSLEGIQRLWLGDLVSAPAWLQSPATRIFAALLTVLGYFGLLHHAREQAAGHAIEPDRSSSLFLSLLLLAVASVPWLIVLIEPRAPYQFYKLLLSVAPLIACGVGILAWSVFRTAGTRGPALAAASVLVLGLPSLGGTASMTLASARAYDDAHGRQNTGIVLNTGFTGIESVLSRMHGRQVVTCAADPYSNGGFVNGWVNYFARFNRVWSLNPRHGNQNLHSFSTTHYLSGFPSNWPSDGAIVTAGNASLWAEGSQPNLRWAIGRMAVYESDGSYALLCHVGLRADNAWQARVALVPDARDLLVVASHDGPATLSARSSDPAGEETLAAGLRVNGELVRSRSGPDGSHVFGLALRRGLNRVASSSNDPDGQPAGLTLVDVRFRLGSEPMNTETVTRPAPGTPPRVRPTADRSTVAARP